MTQHDRPLRIGMGACFFHADPQRAIFKGKTLLYMEESMAHMLMVHGAMVYMLPSIPKGWSAQDLLADLDGLLLQGGSDVAPQSYGETPMKPEWSGDAIRDAYEIELFHAAMALNRPILGACRGIQVINTALGGTLYQDINTQREGTLVHRNWDIYDQNLHTIKFSPDSRLRDWYPNQEGGMTNSVHHQSIKDLAPGLVLEAYSDADDIIEAVRYAPDDADDETPYVYAVQWHPEFITQDDTHLLSASPMLQDFLAACRSQRERRTQA